MGGFPARHTDCQFPQGRDELSTVLAASRPALVIAFVFSIFVNLLLLTSPLYMLQVYDRVLVSGSEETLVALSILAAGLFVLMGVLDHARGRIMARVAARLQVALDTRVLCAAFRRLGVAPGDTAALTAQRDLDAVARFWSSPVALALFDMPWTPVFTVAIFAFHPWLGWLALAGGAVLTLVSWANQATTSPGLNAASLAGLRADRQADTLKSEAELLGSMGMTKAAVELWQQSRVGSVMPGLAVSDIAGRWTVFARTFRLFLQSAMLGLAAWLVLRGDLSAGAMIAASILMGRALQPVEQAIGQWAVVTRARQAHARLTDLLARTPPDAPRTTLPRPRAVLDVQGLTVTPPGATVPVLRGITFSLGPGQAMGIIGTSGAGKSSLARALTGMWPARAGTIRLDGATLDQYDRDMFGAYVGYLPQRLSLFDGTIGENIARLQSQADPARIISAAKSAAAHDMILRLPAGYDTQVTTAGSCLSGGQMQRIGLARALFGDPVMLILDEPNSNLDNEGATALNQSIRAAKAMGCCVLVMAHRPAALQECDLLMVMKDGAVTALGPRDDILRDMVRNSGDVARSIASGAAS